MDLPTPFNPDSKKFFKISELAGKRWPNVTENDIFNWHDEGFKPPIGDIGLKNIKDVIREAWPREGVPDSVMAAMDDCGIENIKEILRDVWSQGNIPESVSAAIDDCWYETWKLDSGIDAIKEAWPQGDAPDGVIAAVTKVWDEEPSTPESLTDAIQAFWEDDLKVCDLEQTNVLGFWVFFPTFDAIMGSEEISSLPDKARIFFEKFPCKVISNSHFRIANENTKGLAYNDEGKINSVVLRDEEGVAHVHGVKDPTTFEFIAGQVEIHKNNLLLKTSSVRLMEELVPGITSISLRSKKEEFSQTDLKSPAEDSRSRMRADKRIEKTSLLIIGTLIATLKGETNFESEAQIIDAIIDRYPKVHGLSERTLQGRFSDAKKALFDATSD